MDLCHTKLENQAHVNGAKSAGKEKCLDWRSVFFLQLKVLSCLLKRRRNNQVVASYNVEIKFSSFVPYLSFLNATSSAAFPVPPAYTCSSLAWVLFFHVGCSPVLGISLICCAVLAEHVSSNASDSESSYRKLLLWFVVLFFAIAPLPVVVIARFCSGCVLIAALDHPHPKQMAWHEIVVWCGKIQKTLGPSVDSSVLSASSSRLAGNHKQFPLQRAVAWWCGSPREGGGKAQPGGLGHSTPYSN